MKRKDMFLPMLALITMPSAASTVENISAYSSTFFTDLTTPAFYIVGLIFGVMLIKYLLVRIPLSALKRFTGGRRRGRR